MSIRKNKDFFPTDKWNILETTGIPVMKTIGSKDMTVNPDTVTLTVPKGERWVILGGMLFNASGQQIEGKIEIREPAGTYNLDTLGYNATLANGYYIYFPNNVGTSGNTPNSKLVYEGQKIVFTWGALAGKSGTSYYYLNALQYNVGQGI